MKYEFLASWTSKLFTKDIMQFKKGIKFVKFNRRPAKDAVFVAQLSIIPPFSRYKRNERSDRT